MSNDLNELILDIGTRYNTFDPFVWADKLNIEIHWKDIYPRPLGDTIYFGSQPIIILANEIRDSSQRYFVLAHELAHVIEHDGLVSYYNDRTFFKHKLEYQADKFAITLVTNLYIEEYGNLPGTYADLTHCYGLPNISD
ncbi:ImmA/IrrE family metallo-endopeptidase [Companilactobacillus allii]|uniref:IrrE N-terminal-like domain-containing protein n=1 Tax=Companilactobacillus allii TaxID=1847728 RepID=A0A1P8Q4X2_9LACO|nr:ImmA/IrrE family metallo-endopeptidase [Companilactobacillus allii]APX72891.1 hypothetical protein BTM29_10150 [Companilactobacillus allii]USQ67679.1 ImmA/IrrE family metallo-endopeptidase [Companilactobacillus allii]